MPASTTRTWRTNHAKKWAFGWLVPWIGRNLAPVKVCLGVPNAHGEGNDGQEAPDVRGGDWIWGRVDPDQLKVSEGLAVALYVALRCSEKRDFDIVWPKIKPLLRS